MGTETRTPADQIDEEKLNEHLQTAVTDFGATLHAPLVVIGDELGLYEALAGADPLTSGELAERTDTAERYVREWLRSQAAGGYVTYDPETDRYSLTPEQTAMLVDEGSPAFVPGEFQLALSAAKIEPQLVDAFRTGDGVGWHEHDADLYHGTERSFGPTYAANLVQHWIPALDGVEAALEAGGRVADVGCGHGASTVLMAEAYPNSTFVGIDIHEPSLAVARERAADAGVSDRVSFDVATAKSYDGGGYDLVTTFDAFHDMGDPVGVAAHVLDTLSRDDTGAGDAAEDGTEADDAAEDGTEADDAAADGTWMIVEPYANDDVEDNYNPVGRAFYSASTLICTPGALDQEGERVLGAQAGEARIREAVIDGGFTRFRRVAETPLNMVFEARP